MHHLSALATNVWPENLHLPVSWEGEWACSHAHNTSLMSGPSIKLSPWQRPLILHALAPACLSRVISCNFSFLAAHFSKTEPLWTECIYILFPSLSALSMLFLLPEILFLSLLLPTWLSPDCSRLSGLISQPLGFSCHSLFYKNSPTVMLSPQRGWGQGFSTMSVWLTITTYVRHRVQ